MPDPVEVAIEAALLAEVKAFAAAQSPALAVSYPDISFTPPEAKSATSPIVYGKYLRVAFRPNPTTRIISGPNTHSGLLLVDVFHGSGAGELAPGRIASALISRFRDRDLARDGIVVQIRRQVPYRVDMLYDGPWTFIPVRIPYDCFAK